METIIQGHIYKATGNRTVFVNAKELTPAKSRALRDHSPDGFSWGYSGSGPAQLALAICLEIYGAQAALRVYQNFKRDYLAPLNMDEDFQITFKPQEYYDNLKD